MQISTSPNAEISPSSTTPETVETTLYELIAALQEAAEPGEEELVTAAVVHLLNSGRARFAEDPRIIKIVRS